MKIVNKKLLEEFRVPGECSLCGKMCLASEAHHLYAVGMGGNGRLDIRINLISLGRSVPYPICPCHTEIHAGKIPRIRIIETISAREHVSVDSLMEVLDWMRRHVGRMSQSQIEFAMKELSMNGQKLARKELIESGKLVE